MRKYLIAANWKMHKNPEEVAQFFQKFLTQTSTDDHGAFLFFPQTITLAATQSALQKTQIAWGAQNCHFETKGAFTGETSPLTLAQMGAKFALIGHSERRSIFHETDEFLAQKMKAVQTNGLTPMLCVGETLSEREQGKTNTVIGEQLKKGLSLCDLTKPITVAYEPVWAIGTGKVATPEQAEEAHAYLRKLLKTLGGEALAKAPILYGGSVKPDNAKELKAKPNIDGFLIGGASLEVDSLLAIYKA